MKKNKVWQKVLTIVFWLVLWQFASQALGQELLLVSPVDVAGNLSGMVFVSGFWSAVAYSFGRIVLGFSLAVFLGIILAGLSSASGFLRTLLAPVFNMIKSIPVVSFIILVLIWSGSSNLSVIISFLMVLPIIYANVLEGILHTDVRLLEMAKVFRLPLHTKLRGIYVPGIMPYFKAGSKIGLGLCWKSGIAAEVIGLPAGGIGEKLYQAKIFLGTVDLFSWTIVVILASFLFEKLFLACLEIFEKWLERIGEAD